MTANLIYFGYAILIVIIIAMAVLSHHISASVDKLSRRLDFFENKIDKLELTISKLIPIMKDQFCLIKLNHLSIEDRFTNIKNVENEHTARLVELLEYAGHIRKEVRDIDDGMSILAETMGFMARDVRELADSESKDKEDVNE